MKVFLTMFKSFARTFLAIFVAIAILYLGILSSFGLSNNVVDTDKVSISLPDKQLDLLTNKVSNETQVLAENNLPQLNVMDEGGANLSFSLWGLLSGNDVDKTALSDLKLVPGGESVGIIVKTDGVLVVGFSGIEDKNGKLVYPGRDGGIETGDCITAINGKAVKDGDHAVAIINSSKGEVLDFAISRDGNSFHKKVKPMYCEKSKTYRVGVYLRDQTGGIGTLTYYDENNQRFGALGHSVSNVVGDDGNASLGTILPATITGLKVGNKDAVGEKYGSLNEGSKTGKIDKTGVYGIYGKLPEGLTAQKQALSVASPDEIEEGKAEIRTVVDGNEVESFSVEITRIDKSDNDGKGLELKVTDKKLLQKTGGIIQGMSGSPIIQNNLIIGAVTYVVVGDPTKGYGCFISSMLSEDGYF